MIVLNLEKEEALGSSQEGEVEGEHCFQGSSGCHPALWQCDKVELEGRHKTLLLIMLLSVRQVPDVVGRGDFQGMKGKAGN